MDVKEKYQRLKELMRGTGSAIVAYSGGTDSTLLLAAAVEELGESVLAVTVRTPLHTAYEIDAAMSTAALLKARHMLVDLDPLSDGRFAENPPDRCYFCKGMILGRLIDIARSEGITSILEGSNADDRRDFRPGARAVRELGVRSPLDEAEITKSELRELSRKLGLPNWDAPARPCLATRFPYGTRITREMIEQVACAEKVLAEAGFGVSRVRHHGDVARIELPESDLLRLASSPDRARIAEGIRKCGYAYVALDLEGYRMGSMNEVLP